MTLLDIATEQSQGRRKPCVIARQIMVLDDDMQAEVIELLYSSDISGEIKRQALETVGVAAASQTITDKMLRGCSCLWCHEHKVWLGQST